MKHIQAYSAPCVILAYSQLCHILNPDIFRTGGLFKILWNVNQTYSGPSTKGILQAYLDIFRILGNAYIRRTLAYLESWNSQNPSVIGSRRIFRTLSYYENLLNIQNSDILKTQKRLKDLRWSFFLWKYLKAIVIFRKHSILGLWTGTEYAYLSISAHQLIEAPGAIYCIIHTLFFVLKEGSAGSKFWLPPPEKRGIWKIKEKGWKYGAGAGPLKRGGWHFSFLIFSRFIIFTFRNYLTLCYPLQNCVMHLKKKSFSVTIIFWKKVILRCLKMNLKISHKLK